MLKNNVELTLKERSKAQFNLTPEQLCFPVVQTEEALVQHLISCMQNNFAPTYAEDDPLWVTYFDHLDSKSCERIFEIMNAESLTSS